MMESLVTHEDIEEWSVLHNIQVPLLNNVFDIVFMDISEDENPTEFQEAYENFMMMSPEVLSQANKYIYAYYKNFTELVGENEFDFSISSREDIWKHIQINEIYITRRPYGNKAVYVNLAGSCEWEVEHGLQIVYLHGNKLARVSDQDGHLTWSDAYDDPKLEEVIYHSL